MPRAQCSNAVLRFSTAVPSSTCQSGMLFPVLEICHANDQWQLALPTLMGFCPTEVRQHKQILLSLLPARTAAQPETQTDSCTLFFSV